MDKDTCRRLRKKFPDDVDIIPKEEDFDTEEKENDEEV